MKIKKIKKQAAPQCVLSIRYEGDKISMRSARHVAHTQQMRNTYEIFSRKPERLRRVW
jgi:hypothetical protein